MLLWKKRALKNEVKKELAKANVKVDAYIPSRFANEDYEKITLYQRMDAITTKKELLAMMDESRIIMVAFPKQCSFYLKRNAWIYVSMNHM